MVVGAVRQSREVVQQPDGCRQGRDRKDVLDRLFGPEGAVHQAVPCRVAKGTASWIPERGEQRGGEGLGPREVPGIAGGDMGSDEGPTECAVIAEMKILVEMV